MLSIAELKRLKFGTRGNNNQGRSTMSTALRSLSGLDQLRNEESMVIIEENQDKEEDGDHTSRKQSEEEVAHEHTLGHEDEDLDVTPQSGGRIEIQEPTPLNFAPIFVGGQDQKVSTSLKGTKKGFLPPIGANKFTSTQIQRTISGLS